MTDAIVQDEIARVHPTPCYSDFETIVLRDIADQFGEKSFVSLEDMYKQFWKNRLD